MLKSIKKLILPAMLIAACYAALHFIGIGCPIRFITGISCPGCGMTRAYLSLVGLDIASAFAFHPLFFLPPVMLVLFVLKDCGKLPRRAFDAAVWVFCIAMLALWAVRFFTGGSIVTFEPENGFIMRLFRRIG